MDGSSLIERSFSYDRAFCRNLGWVTEREQKALAGKRVAVAGLGGAGGSHLVTLARLGIGKFHIADLDAFELANMNRQAGATMDTIGRAKTDVLEQMLLGINPQSVIRTFGNGVTEDNVEDFLAGVDLYVDGLDFFALDIRRKVFEVCARRGIPAITVAPVGMGAALLNFLPGTMTFEEYFCFEGQSAEERALRFLIGLAPARLAASYLVDPSRVDLARRIVPSLGMACELCAGVAAAEALKILLGRGEVLAAPHGIHFDAYTNRLVRTWRPWGNRNPLQLLSLAIGRRLLRSNRLPGKPADAAPAEAA